MVPVLTTTAITSITQTTAVSGGNIIADNGGSVTARGVCWGTLTNPTTANNKTTDATGTGSFVSTLIDLQPGTIYYVRSYAKNSAGTGYGEVVSFTTMASKTPPVVETGVVTDLRITGATIAGKILSDGGDAVLNAGIFWSATNPTPGLSDSRMNTWLSGSIFSAQLTNLTLLTKYYVRAYADNNVGMSFGNVVTFITLGIPPTITNPGATTGLSTAVLTATVNPNSVETTVTFEYGTSFYSLTSSVNATPNPISGISDVLVSTSLSNLEPSNTYYWRVKATSTSGTTYSPITTFKPYVVSDLDGNLYHSVKIGNQIWLVENLKTTKYANGDPIANVTNPDTWGGLTTPAYCWYNNDSKIGEVYGGLYNFYVGTDPRGLISGWHVPIDLEWRDMVTSLGGQVSAYPQLMEAGSDHWKAPIGEIKVIGTNASGFTALPGGCIALSDLTNKFEFMNLGEGAYFWNSELFGPGAVFGFFDISMYFVGNGAIATPSCGFSVRLIKDTK